MENTKAKKVLVGVLVMLLIVCLAVIIWQCVRLNSEGANVTNNTTNGNSQELNTNVTPDVTTTNTNNTTNETSNKETEVKYVSLVTDKINKYNKNAGKENCGDRDQNLYLKVRIPQINVDTANVKKVNNEIYEKYKEYDNDNYTISSNKGGGDIDISYTYKYEPEKSILLVLIKHKYIAHCATGSFYYTSYVYDVKNDKFLTVEDLLKLYDISKEEKQDSIDDAIKDAIGYEDSDEDEKFNEYKSRIANIEKERTDDIAVIDIDNDSFTLWYHAYLGGLTVKLTEN